MNASVVSAMVASALLVGACGSQLDVGLGVADTGSTSIVGGTTSGSTSTTTDVETTTTADTSSSSDPSSTSDATSTTMATAETSESGGDTEGLEESPCLAEQKVCAEVELGGAPVGFCGQTLELQGMTTSLGARRWSIEACGACESCDGEVYEIEIFAPAGWSPQEVPPCARIAIDFAPLDDSPFACAFTGIAIWANSGSTEDPAPVYVAASITTEPPASFGVLQVSAQNVDAKACDEADCCAVPPGKYELAFSDAGIVDPFVLAEHVEELGATVLGETYDVRNERSHAHEQCDRIPHFDWIMLRGRGA